MKHEHEIIELIPYHDDWSWIYATIDEDYTLECLKNVILMTWNDETLAYLTWKHDEWWMYDEQLWIMI